MGTGEWNKEEQSEQVRENPRRDKQNAAYQDEQTIDYLLGRDDSLRKIVRDLPDRSYPFQPREERSDKGSSNDEQDRVEGSDVPSDLNQEVKLHQRDNGEKYEKANDHDSSLRALAGGPAQEKISG